MTPTAKVTAAAAAGALLTLVTFAFGLAGVELNLPDYTVTAVTTALGFLVSWITSDADPGKHAE